MTAKTRLAVPTDCGYHASRGVVRGTHDLVTDELMPEQPPAQLVAMLERLGLANAGQVARMGRRVKRLARDLPRFESVWVDALCQARILTAFQAAEINAGRGQRLRLGPYVLHQRLPHPCYVACYRARNVDSQEKVMLAVVEDAGPRAEEICRQLEALVACVKRTGENREAQGAFHAPYDASLGSITHAGTEGGGFSPPRRGWKGEPPHSGWSTTVDSRPKSCWKSPAPCWPASANSTKPAYATAT